jgi:glycosyltransferase involved in cell wall biosynthesis/GT2 family glycosyltransferase
MKPPPPSLRRRLAAAAPPGTRRRVVAEAGRTSYRAGVNLSRVVRAAGRRAGIELGVLPDDHVWSIDQRVAAVAPEVRAACERGNNTTEVRVVVVDGPPELLAATRASLSRQLWPYAQVEIVAPGEVSDALAGGDPRTPVLLLRAGDRLTPDALFRIADAFWVHPGRRLVSFDDEMPLPPPHRYRFRPTWSPDMLLSANYLGRSFALRAADWAGMGDPDRPASWWEHLLGLGLRAGETHHVTRVLATVTSRPTVVGAAAVPIVQAELDRRNWPAVAQPTADGVRIEWRLPEWPTVSIVVPSRCNRPLLSRLFASLERSTYPAFDVTVIDNSGHDDDKERFYRQWAGRLPLQTIWWDEPGPFNYSRVNNVAVAQTSGEVLVLLNDDTEARSPAWIEDLVGWATRPEIGTVGIQLLDAEGRIQHGGVILGVDGFAGHLFAGMAPGSPSMLGPTSWYRNTLAVTAACVALRRELWDRIGGFDERFVLCGSDVVLGLDAVALGLRNVVSTGVRVDHLESATRGDRGEPTDTYTSWWRYQRWLVGGDPYFSPHLSLRTGVPTIVQPGEPSAPERVLPTLGRSAKVFRQQMSEAEAVAFAVRCRAGEATVNSVREQHARVSGRAEVTTVNWFVPEFDSPFYGGINTILRIADHLRRFHGVTNRFVVLGAPNDAWYRSAISAAFPDLGEVDLVFTEGPAGTPVENLPAADAAIATIWHSAYAVATAPGQRRRFYLVQDFEPVFYPAGTMYALAEESYRLGLYALCNSQPMADMARDRYGATAWAFTPAVDRSVFFPPEAEERDPADPLRIFLYARPGHWRNCWEIASLALGELKTRYADRLHIVAAGSWARPQDLGDGIEFLGSLDVAATGDLYRRCDIGIALTVSEHPSYLPLELMACGVPVVAFDLPEGRWVLRPGENCLLARQTVDGLVEPLDRLIRDDELRRRLGTGALAHIDRHHASWEDALGGVYDFLCDPERLR